MQQGYEKLSGVSPTGKPAAVVTDASPSPARRRPSSLNKWASIPLGVFFFAAGILTCAVLLLFWLLVRPFSRRASRLLSCKVAECWFLQLVWVAAVWGGIRIRLYGSDEDLGRLGKEHSLLLLNHRCDIDWLLGWVILEPFGVLGGVKPILKASLMYIPVVGWTWWLLEYVFVRRSWASDQLVLKQAYAALADYPRPLVLAIFPEGTRFTEAKHKQAQAYAADNGLPIHNNLLVPKTKGFVLSAQQLRKWMASVMDVTLAFPDGVPTFGSLLTRRGYEVHALIRRHDISKLPPDDEGVARWLRDLYVEKDKLLDHHKVKKDFAGIAKERPFSSGSMPTMAMLAWTMVMSAGLIWMFLLPKA
eukprot:jgi/Mesvir1/21177/Mv13909-RA.1